MSGNGEGDDDAAAGAGDIASQVALALQAALPGIIAAVTTAVAEDTGEGDGGGEGSGEPDPAPPTGEPAHAAAAEQPRTWGSGAGADPIAGLLGGSRGAQRAAAGGLAAGDAGSVIAPCGEYNWPARRLLGGDFECAAFTFPELREVCLGFEKLVMTRAEQYELQYSYPVCARLADVLAAHQSGEHPLDDAQLAALTCAYTLLEQRITYLEQQALSAAGYRSQTRQYWQGLARSQLEELQATPVRGSLGTLHAATLRALRAERAKASAKAELDRARKSDDKPP